MPFLLLIVFGIIVYGMVFAQSLSLSNAARQAARSGVVQGTTCAQIGTLVARRRRDHRHGRICRDRLDQARHERSQRNRCLWWRRSTQPCTTQAIGTNVYVTLTFTTNPIVPFVPVPKQLTGTGVYRCEFQ